MRSSDPGLPPPVARHLAAGLPCGRTWDGNSPTSRRLADRHLGRDPEPPFGSIQGSFFSERTHGCGAKKPCWRYDARAVQLLPSPGLRILGPQDVCEPRRLECGCLDCVYLLYIIIYIITFNTPKALPRWYSRNCQLRDHSNHQKSAVLAKSPEGMRHCKLGHCLVPSTRFLELRALTRIREYLFQEGKKRTKTDSNLEDLGKLQQVVGSPMCWKPPCLSPMVPGKAKCAIFSPYLSNISLSCLWVVLFTHETITISKSWNTLIILEYPTKL